MNNEKEMPEVEYLRTILNGIVKNKELVEIKGVVDEYGVFIKFKVHQDDLSRVIGIKGSMVDSIKLLMKGYGYIHGSVRVSIKLIESGDDL